jgi:hypothetical protein
MNIQLGNLKYIKNALVSGEVEFGVVVFDSTFAGFSKCSLRKGQFHLYQNSETPYYYIENGILVDHREGMFVSELQEYFQNSMNSLLKIQVALGGWEVVARFTEQNIGVGFFPDYLVVNGRYPSFKQDLISIPSFEYEIAAVFCKGTRLSKPAKAFINQFTQEE